MTDDNEFDEKYPTGTRDDRHGTSRDSHAPLGDDHAPLGDDAEEGFSFYEDESPGEPDALISHDPSDPSTPDHFTREGDKGNLKKVLGGLFVIAVIGAALFDDTEEEPAMAVEVRCNLEGTLQPHPDVPPIRPAHCLVEQQRGTQSAKVCWEFRLDCRNQPPIVAHECQTVSNGETQRHQIPASKLPNVSTCNLQEGDLKVLNIKIDGN